MGRPCLVAALRSLGSWGDRDSKTSGPRLPAADAGTASAGTSTRVGHSWIARERSSARVSRRARRARSKEKLESERGSILWISEGCRSGLSHGKGDTEWIKYGKEWAADLELEAEGIEADEHAHTAFGDPVEIHHLNGNRVKRLPEALVVPREGSQVPRRRAILRVMSITFRRLVTGDEAAVEAFLARSAERTVFLRSNLSRVGLVDDGAPFSGTYAGAFDGDTLVAVGALYWNGNVVVAPGPHAAPAAAHAVSLSG